MATFAGNPPMSALTGSEIIPGVQGGVDGRTTAQQIADLGVGRSTISTKTASATLALADGNFVEMDVATANSLTVPPNSTVAFPVGKEFSVHQRGAGQTTIVEGAGVTVHTPETKKLRKQWSTAKLVQRGANEWVLSGDLTPYVAPLSAIFALGESSSGSGPLFSKGPGTWSAAITPTGFGTALAQVVAVGTTRLLIAQGTGVRYSDDNAATWTLVTPGQTFGAGIVAVGSTVLAGLSGTDIGRSADSGATWANVATGKNAVRFGARTGLAVALNSSSQPFYSTDDGLTWSALGGRLDSTAESFNPNSQGAANGTTIMFGGDRWGGAFGISAFIPGVAKTTDGSTFTYPVVSTSTTIGSVSVIIPGAAGEWVACTTTGAIFYSTDDGVTWTAATSSLGLAPRGGAYAGGTFVLCGGSAGTGVIKESTDKSVWTTATEPLTYSVANVVRLG